ncbi:MAG: RNA polymerase sigma-70 factor [Bacteroidota bacterium]
MTTFDPDIYILKQINNDDVDAFEVLYKKYYRIVYNYARHFLTEASDCNDIVQDVFTYVWESRNKIKINKSLKSYLLSACHNTCINHLKKRDTKQQHVAHFFSQSNLFEDGYNAIFENELRKAIDDVVDELPNQCSEVFKLSRLKGLKHKEIASLLKISPKTVETQIYRALKVLKKRLSYLILIFFNIFSDFL